MLRISILIVAFVLVFSSRASSLENLIPNPGFLISSGDELSPHFWNRGTTNIEGIERSEFSVGDAGDPPLRALGIKGGEDRSGEWWCRIEGMKKGRRYVLTFKALRDRVYEGIYPEVELFGNRVKFRNHLTYKGWQDLTVIFEAAGEATVLKFINNHPSPIYFSSPLLVEAIDKESTGIPLAKGPELFMKDGEFPLVAYGAKEENFSFIEELGFNGIIAGVNRNNLDRIEAAAMRGLMIVARYSDEDDVVRRLSNMGGLLGWYVEDEPEVRSVPVDRIKERVRRIRESGSMHPTFMAMVRPEFAEYYKDASDIILMDQYPVPNLPLIWLSKSMDEAKRRAGGREIWAVIQIFGGQGWKGKWDREPDYAEMKALSYLAIVHGARGLFFYTLKDKNYDLKRDEAHLNDVKRLLQELRYLCPLFLPVSGGAALFSSDSLIEYSPDGSSPVHARMFSDHKRTIMVAVNALDKQVKGRLSGFPKDTPYFDEYFSGKRFVVRDGDIIDDFKPYDVKIYIAGKEYRNMRIMDAGAVSVKVRFYAEVAETQMDKVVGLMFRGLPSKDRALLFQSEKPEDIEIHALNVRDDFDLVFFDKDGKVSALYKNVAPCYDSKACSRYRTPVPSKTVVELRAGVIDEFHISLGDRLELY